MKATFSQHVETSAPSTTNLENSVMWTACCPLSFHGTSWLSKYN